MPCPLFSPPIRAATPATMAPPWMRQDGLRTVANIRPSLTAWIAGGMASTPPIRMLVRLRAFMMLAAASAMSSLWKNAAAGGGGGGGGGAQGRAGGDAARAAGGGAGAARVG